MRSVFFFTVLVATFGVEARAGEKVLVAATPGWVSPETASAGSNAAKANSLLRFDQQIQVDGGKVTTYFDTTIPISSPEVLNQRGTISLPWQPSHGDLTFYRIDVIRDGKVIDALRSGKGFTVLRREAGLERLSIDGTLTAVKHLENLQVGDRLRVAFSISTQDDVLGGKAQDAMVLLPAPTKLEFERARLIWRTARPLAWKSWIAGVTAQPKAIDGTWTELTIPLPIAKLPETPKNMPSRFTPVPVVQFTSFVDWNAVAAIMAPLYQVKNSITPGSALDGRIETIKRRSDDPIVPMADALRMVQDEVRYQLMALGTGNYVPQRPNDTWEKRYGDCKAKTVLLLAILDRLGIEAEPVMANIKRGDAVAEMLPSAMDFDHAFVRARVNGEDFWLDGTQIGSRIEDIRDVPRYGYVLPLFTPGNTLLDLPRRANARRDSDVEITYDMTAGPHLPTPYKLSIRYAGLAATRNRVQQSANYDDDLTKFVEGKAKSWTGSDRIGKPLASYG